MKKIVFIGLCSLLAFASCDDRNDIRQDIDNLNARLDALDGQVEALNKDLANCQALYEGIIMIKGYEQDVNGNYTLTLSNGETLKVYSGKSADELPEMSIGEDGYWYYTLNGKKSPLLDSNGQRVSATPVDGKGLQVRVNASGYWEYSVDGTNWQDGIGMADPTKGGIGTSIFTKVEMTDKGLALTWTDSDGQEQMQVVASLDDFMMEMVSTGNLSFKPGETKKLALTQVNVDKIVIEPTAWSVQVGETDITLTAPSVNSQGKPYSEKIYVKYFSRKGYAKLMVLQVELLNN